VAQAGGLVRRAGRPGVRRKKGAIERLYASPPGNSVVVCIDEMGPLSVKPYPGREPVCGREGVLAGRARWELALDRGRKPGGYVFGAFIPATGEALTETYESRSIGRRQGRPGGWSGFQQRTSGRCAGRSSEGPYGRDRRARPCIRASRMPIELHDHRVVPSGAMDGLSGSARRLRSSPSVIAEARW
jgi:hypothetical protein